MVEFDNLSIDVFELSDLPEDKSKWQSIIKRDILLVENSVFTVADKPGVCYVVQSRLLGPNVRKLSTDDSTDVEISMKIFDQREKNKINKINKTGK